MHPLRQALRLVFGLALMGSMSVMAQAATSPIKQASTVTSSVANTCVIQSADSVSFGAYDPTSIVASTATNQINLICTAKAVYTLSPSLGGTQMKGPSGQTLNYALYIDAARSKVFGASTFQSVQITPSGTGNYYFSNAGMTLAQFNAAIAADPTLKNTPYARTMNATNGTDADAIYYTGFLGQSATAISGAHGSVPVILERNGVVATNSTPTNASLTPYNPAAGGNYVYYNLIVPANTPVSGGVYTVQAVGGTASLTGTATSAKTPIALALYGQVPARQDVTPGVFTDTVILLLTF